MSTFNGKERRNSQRVPVRISVLGLLGDRRVAMYSENISLDGMFMRAADFIPPRIVLAARIWLSTDEEPLQAYLSSRFIDRTWESYGIGMSISGTCTADKKLWESFYHCCAEAQAEQQSLRAPLRAVPESRHIVVVDEALSPLALQALRRPWLQISQVDSVHEAMALMSEQRTDLAVSDLRRSGKESLSLCRVLRRAGSQVQGVLLCDGESPSDYLPGIHAGAALVIGKQCIHRVLASRILGVLEQRQPNHDARPASL